MHYREEKNVETKNETVNRNWSDGAADYFRFRRWGTGAPVRVVVESNRRTRVLGIVFDTSTQRVVAIIHPFSDF